MLRDTALTGAEAGLAMIDDEGYVLAMNAPALALLGRVRDRVVGQPAAAFLPLLNTTPLSQVGHGHKALGIHADGSVLHLSVSVTRLSVTDFEGWVMRIQPDPAAAAAARH